MGAFVAAIINFVLLALCIFAMVKGINSAKRAIQKENKEEEKKEEAKSPEVILLEEIRNLLKEEKN